MLTTAKTIQMLLYDGDLSGVMYIEDTSWQIGAMAVDDSPSPMKVDMTLQFESMVILDGDNILHEAMG